MPDLLDRTRRRSGAAIAALGGLGERAREHSRRACGRCALGLVELRVVDRTHRYLPLVVRGARLRSRLLSRKCATSKPGRRHDQRAREAVAQLRCRNYTHGMNTAAGPTLSQVLGWLDEGVRGYLRRSRSARPEHVIWTMLERETAALRGDIAVADGERARWVLSWVRYMRYRGADPIEVRKAALLVAGGAKARHVAKMLGLRRELHPAAVAGVSRQKSQSWCWVGSGRRPWGRASPGGRVCLPDPKDRIDKPGRLWVGFSPHAGRFALSRSGAWLQRPRSPAPTPRSRFWPSRIR